MDLGRQVSLLLATVSRLPTPSHFNSNFFAMADAGELVVHVNGTKCNLIVIVRILQRNVGRPGSQVLRQGAQAPQDHEVPA